jgi:hypothetical protein
MSEPEYVYIVHCATGSGDDIAVSRTSEGAEGIARGEGGMGARPSPAAERADAGRSR